MPLVLGLAVALVCALGAVWVSARPSDNGGGAGAKPSTTVSAPDAGTATPTAAGTTGPAGQGPTPKGATSLGSAVLVHDAPAGAAAVTLFVDPQCPICGQFEAIFGPAVTELVKNNEAKVIVHTMTFLDRNLRNDSSVRAANAAFCAADQGKFHDYTIAVYAAQPAREGDGWTDAQLTSFAQSVGLAGTALDSWKTCQQAVTYRAHIAALETNSERSGVNGTPTALLNGTRMNLAGLDAAAFRAAVKAAKP